MSQHLAYYSVVRILPSDETAALRIDGHAGVVLGVTDSGEHVEYAVLIRDESFMVNSRDLAPTGEVLSRDAIYGGSSVRVQPQRSSENEVTE